MASAPSIKGLIFARAMEDLQKLVAEGAVSRETLAARLEPEDIELFDRSVYLETLDRSMWTAAWYDVRMYGRILEALKDHAGDGSNDYLLQRGAESAQAMLDQGLYQQLQYLDRTRVASASGSEERFRAFGHDLRLLTSLHSVILNFGVQTVEPDPDHERRYRLRVTGAEPAPDALCWTTTGFMNRMARQHDAPDLWRFERPERDIVLYRMTRPA